MSTVEHDKRTDRYGIGGGASAPAGEHNLLPMDKVVFGPGSVAKLAAEIDRVGGTRALIVTGNTLATQTDLVERLIAILGDRFAGVFSDTRAHVPRSTVIAATEALRDAKADAIISFGGGSPNDTAKLAALSLAAGVTTEAELSELHFRVEGDETIVPPVPDSSIPHIAIPTTLSGGEFTLWGGATDAERLVKDAYGAPHLTARTVILDPELTLATPDWLWGSTGMRAMDHAVETVYSIGHNPFADALTLQAVGMLVRGLDACRENPQDLTARGVCQMAAWMSITSLPSVPAGLSHAIGHQLGARCDVPHGVTSCIVLPEAMEFNLPATLDRQALLAEAMGIDVGGLSAEDAAAAAPERLRQLVRDLGVKNRLSEWGVEEADLAPMADDIALDFMATTNPRKVESPDQVVELLRRVL
jgi:alcohol dehydrogenase class IV